MRFIAALVVVAASAGSATGQARVVFRGEVASIAPADGMWAGRVVARQQVEFSVREIVSGALPDRHVAVHWTILRGSPDVDPLQPHLRGDLFAVGKVLEVTIEPQPSPVTPGTTIWVAVPPTAEAAPAIPVPVRRRGCLGCSPSDRTAGPAFAVAVLFVLRRRRRRCT
jgi:hypothetical protein